MAAPPCQSIRPTHFASTPAGTFGPLDGPAL